MPSIDPLGAALIIRARNAIATALGLPTTAEPAHADLDKPGATFVTLRCGGKLRGCVGTLEPIRPLDEDIRHAALAAAFADPRFQPLKAEEFAGLSIEVSVIGAVTPLAVASEAEALAALRPYEDGLTLRWHGAGSTLLPQVWTSLPQPREFLDALKRKAGLPGHFWDDEIELSRYSVVHFEEAIEILE